LLWERQKRDGTYSSEKYIRTVRYQVNLANEAVLSIPKSEEVLAMMRGFTYSASALDTYLQCPIKFYYDYIVRLKEKEEAVDDLDNKDIGIFIHDVMEEFYKPFVGTELEMRELNQNRLEQLVDELFTQKFGSEPAGGMYLLKRQIQRQLKKMLMDYQYPILETNKVLLKGLEQNIVIHAFGYKFKGRLDRIEQRGSKIFILDYKTGTKPSKPPINFSKLNLAIDGRESWNEAVTSLQLPMYLFLYSVHTNTAIEQIVPAYLYLGINRLGKDCEVAFIEDPEERVTCFEQVKQLIELLVQEMNNAEMPFSPPADLNKICPRCPYTGLCGTAWVQNWKV